MSLFESIVFLYPGFALVLLSMFFFYLQRRASSLLARRFVAAVITRTFFCFAHGPPITPLHSCDHNAAQLPRPRRNPRGVDRGPPAASLFLQIERTKPALQIRKNSAATSHPPIACWFAHRGCTFPPPMRRHVACSGFLYRACASLAGNRRAGAPAKPLRGSLAASALADWRDVRARRMTDRVR